VRGPVRVLVLGWMLLTGPAGIRCAAAASALPKTHGAVLDSVAGMVAAELLRGATIPAGRAVRFTAPLAGDSLGFLAQHVVEQLRASGAEVRLLSRRSPAEMAMGDDPGAHARVDSTDLDLHLEVRSAGVTYIRAIRKFPFGVRGYQRLASMQVGASLVDCSTREVLWARSASAQTMDEVRRADLGYAQSGSGGINPPPPRAGGGTRLLEPLIVVGVVTGLVVLFYSNRN